MQVRKLAAPMVAVFALMVGLVAPAHAANTVVQVVYWPGPEGDAMTKVVAAYNSGQGKKDGVTAKMILLSRDNTFAKEATMMTSKSSTPDMYFTASYLVGQHSPYLVPLKINGAKYLKASLESLQVNGKQMALPLDTSLHFLYYRKDLVSQLSDSANAALYSSIAQKVLGKAMKPNLNPLTWSWDDTIAAAAYFTQQYNPASPTKYGFAMQGKNLLYNTMIWNDVLWGSGGNWFKNGKPNINTPSGIAAINVYNTLYTKGITSPDSSNAEYPETNAAIESGNAAFALQWNAAYSELNSKGESAGKIGIAPPPGTGGRTHVHALAVGLNKYSKNQAASLKFISWLDRTSSMELYAKSGGIPSVTSVLSGMTSVNPSFAYLTQFANEYGYSESAGPNEFQMYGALAQALSPAWDGLASASSAAAAADAAIAPLR